MPQFGLIVYLLRSLFEVLQVSQDCRLARVGHVWPANGLQTQTGVMCSVAEAGPVISQNISAFAPESFNRLEEAQPRD